ncbi:MAG: HEAT repeat domain-containing protein [Chloroflexota bacterium]|nr:HEAT repeat domain-containing protein [Chloroflexota bacterium]
MKRESDWLASEGVAASEKGLHVGLPLSALLQRGRPSQSWRFDPVSALLGAMVAFFVAALAYRYRASLQARWQAIRDGVDRFRARLTSSLEDRYRAQVATAADAQHLLARFAPLTDLHVTPPLNAPPTSPTCLLTEEEGPTGEAARDRRRLKALLDEPLPLELGSALRKYPRLAIMGPLGAGKSALLTYLTATFARRQAADDLGLDEDRLPLLLNLPELDLDVEADDRSRRRKGRDREIRVVAGSLARRYRGLRTRAITGLFRQRLQSGGCCLLCDGMDEMADEARQQAEVWLVELLQAYPDNQFVIVATPRSYDRLVAAGFVCLTLGEFTSAEALAFAQRWQAATDQDAPSAEDESSETLPPVPWLPRRGKIRPLDLALRAAMWTEHDVVPAGRVPLLALILEDALGQINDSPFSTDRWRAALGSLALTMHREGQFTTTRETVEELLHSLFMEESEEEPSQAPGDGSDDEGNTPVVPDEVEEHIEDQADAPSEGEQPPDQEEGEQEPVEQEISEKEQKRRDRELARQEKLREKERRQQEKEAEKQLRREERQLEKREQDSARRARKALSSLLRDTALLVELDDDRLAFASPALRTYLTAWQLAQTGDPQSDAPAERAALPAEHISDLHWQEVFALYATIAPVTPLVVARMQGKDDLLRSDLLAAAEYISLASQSQTPPHRNLRDGILSELAKALMRPGQPLALRRALALALVRTGNKGVPVLFQRALADDADHLRAMAAWGLGEWADEQFVPSLVGALSDPEWLVRATALYALVTIGGEAATDGLVEGLQHEDEFTRRVAAEMLVRLGAAGHGLLKEAVELPDMHIRRAAVYGLGLVNEDWVFPMLDELRRNDPEWFVRSAVEETIAAQERAATHDFSPRPLSQVGWLARWSAERGLSVGSDEAARSVLLQALAQGDWPVRLAAADTLRAQGGPWAVDVLLQTLTDKDDLVREVAFAALKDISRRSGQRIVL